MAESVARRELQLRLNLIAGSDSAALTAIAAEAEKIDRHTSAAAKSIESLRGRGMGLAAEDALARAGNVDIVSRQMAGPRAFDRHSPTWGQPAGVAYGSKAVEESLAETKKMETAASKAATAIAAAIPKVATAPGSAPAAAGGVSAHALPTPPAESAIKTQQSAAVLDALNRLNATAKEQLGLTRARLGQLGYQEGVTHVTAAEKEEKKEEKKKPEAKKEEKKPEAKKPAAPDVMTLLGAGMATPETAVEKAKKEEEKKKGLSFTQAWQSLAGETAGYIAAIGAAISITANMTKAFQGLDNPMTTAAEKAVGFAEAIPLVGSALGRLITDSLEAVERLSDPELAKRVDRARIEQPILLAQSQARFAYEQKSAELHGEVASAGFRAAATAQFPTLASTNARGILSPDPFTAATFRAVDAVVDPRMKAAMEAVQTAKREAASAEMQAKADKEAVESERPAYNRAVIDRRTAAERSRAELAEAMEPGSGARSRAYNEGREIVQRRNGDGFASAVGGRFVGAAAYLLPETVGGRGPDGSASGGRLAMQDAAMKEAAAKLRFEQEDARIQASIAKSKESQLAATVKLHEITRAINAQEKTRLTIMEEQEAKMRGAQRQFGALDEVAQRGVLESFERFKKGGKEAITQEELQRLSGLTLTEKSVGESLEKEVKDNPAFKKLFELTGQRDADTIKADIVKAKAELDIKIQIDEEQFGKLMEEKLKKLNLKELLGDILKNQLEANLRKPALDSFRGRAERGS